MTARGGNSGDTIPSRGIAAYEERASIVYVGETCTMAIGGRRAARAVAEWAKRFGLTEAELQVLWRLRAAPSDGFDQTALANALAFSPAQISASVEQLRAHGRIRPTTSTTDRRRRHWHLSATGRELIDQLLVVVTLVRREPNGDVHREAAA